MSETFSCSPGFAGGFTCVPWICTTPVWAPDSAMSPKGCVEFSGTATGLFTGTLLYDCHFQSIRTVSPTAYLSFTGDTVMSAFVSDSPTGPKKSFRHAEV
ncbi:hypothetical protein ACU686_06050 [Yinghuangia aomiensis]